MKAAAQVFVKLMQRLGYSRYVAAGGDWGMENSRKMSKKKVVLYRRIWRLKIRNIV